ncbi:MAG: signal peptidase I [Solirubrobacteraceae bacterium]
MTAVVLALGGLGWFYLAPTQIGGSTRYMITHGISMQPMLHTGDLAIVRPAGNYKVGEVVAYHSTLLHTVVLHRIHAIRDGRYTFKGDNNDFIDPTHPTRALLVGRMWLHIPHGGTVLEWVHKPWVAAVLTGGVAMLLLFGGDQTRRRRRHRRQDGESNRAKRPPTSMGNRRLLVASIAGVLLFAALSVFAFVRPAAGTTTVRTPYTQELNFGYHGPARVGSVYPNGTVTTGEPIYLQLVRQLTITAAYKLATTAPNQVHGSIRVKGTLSNDSGWRRRFWLGSLMRFSGDRGVARAHVDLSRLQALSNRVSTQIGEAGGGSYTLTVEPEVKLAGEISGSKVATSISPPLNLALGSDQLVAGGSAMPAASSPAGSASGSGQQGLDHSTPGSVTSTRRAVNKLAGVPVKTVRVIAIAAFVLFALLALLAGGRELRGTADSAEKINSRYKHLIVPVGQITPDEEHPPIDVSTIAALAQLAERSERLILHEHRDDADNYMIDDQGTVFRYQASRLGGTRGNGNGSNGTVGTSARDVSAHNHSLGAVAETDETAAPAAAVAAATVTGSSAPGEPADDPGAAAASGPGAPGRPGSGANPGTQRGARPAPATNSTHWSRRPEARAGFAVGPLALALLAWRRLRKRRLMKRQAELVGRWYTPTDRSRAARPQPPRGPGDRRRGERRHD